MSKIYLILSVDQSILDNNQIESTHEILKACILNKFLPRIKKIFYFVCPKFMQLIWTIFIHIPSGDDTYEKCSVEINERVNIQFQDIFIDTFIIFHSESKKFTETKTDIIWRFKMGNMFKFLLHSELTCTIFQCIIWAVISFAMGNPRRLFIFSHDLKSDKLKGAF